MKIDKKKTKKTLTERVNDLEWTLTITRISLAVVFIILISSQWSQLKWSDRDYELDMQLIQGLNEYGAIIAEHNEALYEISEIVQGLVLERAGLAEITIEGNEVTIEGEKPVCVVEENQPPVIEKVL